MARLSGGCDKGVAKRMRFGLVGNRQGPALSVKVIGTTGLSPQQLGDLALFAEKASMGGAVIPNFSVGMVLLQQAAAAAAQARGIRRRCRRLADIFD